MHGILQKSPLFAGMPPEKIQGLLQNLHSWEKQYVKGEFLRQAGETTAEMGLLLTGEVHILREDFWGNSRILGNIMPGDLFGEAFACSGQPMTVSVQAVQDSRVCYLNCQGLLAPGGGPEQELLRCRLLRILAAKNQRLVGKMEHMSQKTTREKLLSYLSEQAQLAGKREFIIPFNRQQLADYLGVERSAMSAQLSQMQKEGILDYQRSWFRLNREAER